MATKVTTAGPDRSSKLNLSFGLVTVPIRYKPLAESKSGGVSAKMMCEEHHAALNQGAMVCSRGTADEHTVERGDIVKGYPHPDNPKQFVIVDPSVLDEFAESRTGDAAIKRIVDFSSIDPAYFDKVYTVWPGDGDRAAQSFDLFASVLREGGKAAVTTTVISKQTRTVIFRWSDDLGCLIAHVCRFQSQIRLGDVEVVGAVAERRAKPSEEELGLARQILSSLEGEFDPGEITDTWTPAIQDAIRQVGSGQEIKPSEKTGPVEAANNLMDALKASVVAAKATPKAAPKKVAKKPVSKTKQPA